MYVCIDQIDFTARDSSIKIINPSLILSCKNSICFSYKIQIVISQKKKIQIVRNNLNH